MKLSHLFRDPVVRAAFERAERDDGAVAVVARPVPPRPPVSAARVLEGV